MESLSSKKPSSSKKRVGVKKDKLYLEDYLHFLRYIHTVDLSVNLLNQIIYIHGFRKLHKHTKSMLVDAVNALDLMDLPRSTLDQIISSSATLALEDVIYDLNELGWQECCVTSVYSLSNSSCKEKENQTLPLNQYPQLLTTHFSTKSRSKTLKRFCNVDKLSGVFRTSFQNDRHAMKLAPRKRKMISDSESLDCASAVDSVSLASN